MNGSTKIVIKARLGAEIKKSLLSREDMTYDDLCQMMVRIFAGKLKNDDDVCIKYRDEDDELITISNDDELKDALIFTKCNLSLVLIRNNEPLILQDDQRVRVVNELERIRNVCNQLLDSFNSEARIRVVDELKQKQLDEVKEKENKLMEERIRSQAKEFDPLKPSGDELDNRSVYSEASGAPKSEVEVPLENGVSEHRNEMPSQQQAPKPAMPSEFPPTRPGVPPVSQIPGMPQQQRQQPQQAPSAPPPNMQQQRGGPPQGSQQQQQPPLGPPPNMQQQRGGPPQGSQQNQGPPPPPQQQMFSQPPPSSGQKSFSPPPPGSIQDFSTPQKMQPNKDQSQFWGAPPSPYPPQSQAPPGMGPPPPSAPSNAPSHQQQQQPQQQQYMPGMRPPPPPSHSSASGMPMPPSSSSAQNQMPGLPPQMSYGQGPPPMSQQQQQQHHIPNQPNKPAERNPSMDSNASRPGPPGSMQGAPAMPPSSYFAGPPGMPTSMPGHFSNPPPGMMMPGGMPPISQPSGSFMSPVSRGPPGPPGQYR